MEAIIMSYNFFVKSNIDFGRGALGDLAQILQGYQMKSAQAPRIWPVDILLSV